MEPSRILVVEDEVDLAETVTSGLSDEGFEVELATSGSEAVQSLGRRWDLIILDLMLPDTTGESVLAHIRQQPHYPAVLVLTARGTMQDKLSLFRGGCDDYLTKPFIFEELLERVRALLRRPHRVVASDAIYRDLSLDPSSFEISSSEGKVTLTPKEAAVLRLLIDNRERVVSRKELLLGVWGLSTEPDTNFIGVHLFNLRKKLSSIGRGEWLRTVRSSGFVLRAEESRDDGD